LSGDNITFALLSHCEHVLEFWLWLHYNVLLNSVVICCVLSPGQNEYIIAVVPFLYTEVILMKPWCYHRWVTSLS